MQQMYQYPQYSSYYPIREDMMYDMQEKKKMMEMMRQHMMMTKDIKQNLEVINERLKRIEGQLNM